MAAANKDVLGPAEDMVSIADGGGPFQDFDDVPGKTSKQLGITNPDRSKGNLFKGQGQQTGLGGADKDNLAGR